MPMVLRLGPMSFPGSPEVTEVPPLLSLRLSVDLSQQSRSPARRFARNQALAKFWVRRPKRAAAEHSLARHPRLLI